MSRLVLAPMEGLADNVLRDVLTRIARYDWCVTEFIRVSGSLLPPRTFKRVCPELENGGRTLAGTPVRVQLLGSDPACLAENAARLAELGPAGIDLNFGCPAPTVNRHRGGAALLDEPELLHRIAGAVRAAIPRTMPFSAKMRLGIAGTERALDCARALVAGGVRELVVHARTKADGYRPPARWEWIARIREAVDAVVIANGEVWSADDHARIVAVSGCADVMLGRGAASDPFLARRVRGEYESRATAGDWKALRGPIADFWRQVREKVEPRHVPGRLKQWLNMLRQVFPEAEQLYLDIRPLAASSGVDGALVRHGCLALAKP